MRSRVAVVLGFFVALVFANVSAQTTQDPRAQKLYEFGSSNSEYQKALLDFFAIEIQRHTEAEAYVVTYAPEGDGLGTGKQLLGLYKQYLVDTRGLESQRVKTIYGGHNNDPHEAKTELWLVPKGAEPPSLARHENDYDTFRGRFADLKAEDDFGVLVPEGESEGIGTTTDASFAEILHRQKDAFGYIV